MTDADLGAMRLKVKDEPASPFFDVRRFGAAGDGLRLDTEAVQQAIDQCGSAGGGTVLCPPGIYLIGTIELKDRVELHLAAGATLRASTDRQHYRTLRTGERPREHLVIARNASHIAVTGRGTIDGQGTSFFEPIPGLARLRVRDWRPYHMLAFVDCRDVLVRDVHLNDAPCYALWPLGCTGVWIQGITITSNRFGPNTDGIDPDCCRDVFISDCRIDCGDDCIALKSDTWKLGRMAACENVVVTNCSLRTTCCGVRIGYEGDGPIRNCVFSNLVMHETRTGINLLVPRDIRPERGFTIEHGPAIEAISFSNLVMDTQIAFYLWIGDEAAPPGGIRNISISDVIARTEDGCYVAGAQRNPIEDVRFHNVALTVTGSLRDSFGDELPYPFPAFGHWPRRGIPHAFFCRDAKDLRFDDVSVRWQDVQGAWRSGLRAERVSGLDLQNLRATAAPGAGPSPALDLARVESVSIRNTRATPGAGAFLRVSDSPKDAVRLAGCDLADAGEDTC